MANRQDAEATAAFRKTIELNPAQLPAYDQLATIAVRQGKVDEAIQRLSEALKINPNNIASNLAIGRLYMGQGKPDKALAHFETVSRVNPDLPGVNLFLADLYLRLRRPDDTIARGKQALRVDPKLAGAHLGGRPAARETAMVLYTSGSTGRPKGVPLSHDGHLWAVRSRVAAGSQGSLEQPGPRRFLSTHRECLPCLHGVTFLWTNLWINSNRSRGP